MTQLQSLFLGSNQLDGEIPTSIIKLNSSLIDLSYNKLISNNPKVLTFFKEKSEYGRGWAGTQTVTPRQIKDKIVSVDTIELTWMPIPYAAHGGFYEISYSTTPGGPYIIHGNTKDKTVSRYLVSGLTPKKSYYFVIRSYTPTHLQLPEFSEYNHWWSPQHLQPAEYSQQNNLWSDFSREIEITIQ
jgi:hypothetical protein